MPLAFRSTTHGTVAFGFFNIETDLLLLENRFFFATDFSRWVTALSEVTAGRHETIRDVWTIDRREDLGDLMGAIHGTRHTGFIGSVYLRHPFPLAPEGFRQQPEGDRTQAEITVLIDRWARRESIAVVADQAARHISIGGIGFTLEGFRELVAYVQAGGHPRWRDESPPPYVVAMARALETGAGWVC